MARKPDVITDPLTNRGTAFTHDERARLGLSGRLPSAVEPLDEQVARCYAQLTGYETDMEKYVYLDQLHDRKEVLYYKVISEHLAELLPIVYDPTVGDAIKQWSQNYRASRAIYLSIDRPEDVRPSFETLGLGPDDVDLIVVSDAQEILVWQTGSGTQSNMNTNEVISNRAIQLAGGQLGSKTPVHPNDHVNMGQSSNDTFPTAMHIAVVTEFAERLIPAVEALQKTLAAKAVEWKDVVKTGRTHLEDATPLTVGQEWSGYARQLEQGLERLRASMDGLYELGMGGTAVGTGLNAPAGFDVEVAATIAELTGHPFVTAANKFAAQGGLDAMVGASAGLRALAVPLMKIANDIRWLASGPRCGLGELILPANEPGSSIMPGKVNPTQCEAMVMVCIQVIGEDNAVGFAGTQGNFELNAMRPIILNNVLHSARILGDASVKLREFCIEGTELNRAQIDKFVGSSLMLVTALSPVIGYDKASAIAHKANDEGTTLREAALATGYVDAADFDRIVDPTKMVGTP